MNFKKIAMMLTACCLMSGNLVAVTAQQKFEAAADKADMDKDEVTQDMASAFAVWTRSDSSSSKTSLLNSQISKGNINKAQAGKLHPDFVYVEFGKKVEPVKKAPVVINKPGINQPGINQPPVVDKVKEASKEIFGSDKLPKFDPKSNDQLTDYIAVNGVKNLPVKELRDALIKAGWKADDIDGTGLVV